MCRFWILGCVRHQPKAVVAVSQMQRSIQNRAVHTWFLPAAKHASQWIKKFGSEEVLIAFIECLRPGRHRNISN